MSNSIKKQKQRNTIIMKSKNELSCVLLILAQEYQTLKTAYRQKDYTYISLQWQKNTPQKNTHLTQQTFRTPTLP